MFFVCVFPSKYNTPYLSKIGKFGLGWVALRNQNQNENQKNIYNQLGCPVLECWKIETSPVRSTVPAGREKFSPGPYIHTVGMYLTC